MNALQEVKRRELEKKQLSKQNSIDEEVTKYKNKLSYYGINNRTAKSIDEKLTEQSNKNKILHQNENLNELIDIFQPFSIIEYKTLDEVCKDYKLCISSISNYDKPIPDENLIDIDNYVEKLKNMKYVILRNVLAKENDSFTFSIHDYRPLVVPKTLSSINDINYYSTAEPIETSKMFKIAAPKTHFDIPNNYDRIGNEYHRIAEKPKFSFTPELKKPNYDLDPIVFTPIKFFNKIYCIVITAWDKEADDARILSKL